MNILIKQRASRTIFTLVIIAGLVSSCNLENTLSGKTSKTPAQPPVQPDSGLPLAEITFELTTLTNSPADTITLEILDEITGLAFNPKRYDMETTGGSHYKVVIPIAIGSVVKYRYISPASPTAVEYTAGGKQVRYRLFRVDGPAVVTDIVSAWTGSQYEGPTGRISGQIIDRESNTPIPSALVSAGGAQTLTASDGTFLLEGLATGTHNMVVYALDGKFTTFQQGATIAENATTPASVYVDLVKTVKVTFVAQVPAADIKGFPLRLIGSTYSLGNTFADLDGGMSSVASHAPILSMIADDIYSVTLELPVGMDLKYKYSLGDGFWNAEHNPDGSFRIRQLIVPDKDLTITDIITGWKTGTASPVTFTVKVPQETPPGDFVSIQFNPYGWTSPIPMWPLGNNQWLYVLYGPLDYFGEIEYRYCRNDLCGIADDEFSHGDGAQVRKFNPAVEPQSITDEVSRWSFWSGVSNSTTIIAPEIAARDSTFIAGVEFTPNFSPFWQPYTNNGLQAAKQYGSNWVVLSPTWSYASMQPAIMEPVTGQDPLWADSISSIKLAESLNLNAAIFPRLQTKTFSDELWEEAILDSGWWDGWFERYQKFALHYADLAAQTQASMLILGGPDVTPALPEGTLPDGNPSGVPDYAEDKWQGILAEVQKHYKGQIAWAIPYPYTGTPLPDWLESMDAIYLLFSPPLSESLSPTQGEIQETMEQLLDEEILPLAEQTGKPIILALDYPSAEGAAAGCIRLSDQCLPFTTLNQPAPAFEGFQVDLQEQVDIYSAAFNAINDREWINGFVSRGFFYPASLQDTSSSIHGKPASDVIWYWFPKLLGQ